MTCPSCSRPLWGDFAANLYRPRAGRQETQCRKCAHRACYALPSFLVEEAYVYFGATVIALTMLAALSMDAAVLVRLNACASVFVVWLGLIGLLTWTRTEVK